jgi:ADP-ribose pyrophosphatase YjhB (NUDIX family)
LTASRSATTITSTARLSANKIYIRNFSVSSQPTVVAKDIDGNEHIVPVSQLRWRPSAYGIVIKDGALLTAKHFGRHNLPGGGVELGEMPEAAVIREIKEETGIDAANPRLVSMASQFFKLPHTERGKEFCQSILLYYVCDFAGGEFSMDGFDEAEKIYAEMPEWYPLAKLDTLEYTGSHDWRGLVK